jgi:plastocyanin
MKFKEIAILCMATAFATVGGAQDITGTILIKRKLTKPSVTASVSVYQRGTAVKLGKDAEEDPIAYERSRVVLYLEGAGPAGDDAANLAPRVQQLDRRFQPDLIVVPIGSTVSFPNMDPIFHNIYSLSKPKAFDLGSYDKGETRKVTFPKPGIVDIYCHLHPNMAATIVVTPNRWYARPDRSGKFRIPNVPPGQYTVVAWHKSAGFFRKTIVVENGHDAITDFFIPLEVDAKLESNATDNLVHTGGAR